MYTQKEAEDIIKLQLAIEYNCKAEDFKDNKNLITERRFIIGCREYSEKWPLFKMITFGGNSIISTTPKIKKRIEKIVEGAVAHRLFEYKTIIKFDKVIRKYGELIKSAHHMYIPLMEIKEITPKFDIKWYERNELMPFYSEEKWSNALSAPPHKNGKDVLAVTALIDGKIVGMAGCSQDTHIMWQIGVDVLEEYRGNGIGSTLVQLLKNEIIKREKIPFYGTSSANVYSTKIALKCGFIPSWIETESRNIISKD